ncbi:nucleotidyltransferase [Brevibacillus laterosporus]|uniref:nucleotidyltransferase domain-containing protein n=1 Tax=Brevibacillus laterosporus TaxID=1465 RepID=UPI000CE53A5B|nr:nucleotidyltransferase [Brevibacillus laterosporus]PPA87640.1 nucleotidyltransferase [Brevibacillus laterosporus]
MFELKGSLDATFQSWSKPASDTEESKCENALRMIRDALNKSEALSKYEIQLIPKGSYHNNTNVRLTSDVDIAVKLKDVFFANYPEGKTGKDFGNFENNYTFSQYRNDIEQAMIDKFESNNIEFGNKAIQINSNSYRVVADVVPCFEHRRYSQDGTYIKGTEFITRHTNQHVINFPEQHYSNGLRKNNETSRRYKKVVRIFKRLRYNLLEKGYSVENVSSFLVESLIWNVPNNNFNSATLTEDVKQCFDYLITQTSDYEKCKKWGEVSELLYLFHNGRKYTCSDAHRFLVDGYAYLF